MDENNVASGVSFGGTIRSVLGSLKNEQVKFLSFEGKCTRQEFWATYLAVSLPLAVVYGIFFLIASVLYDDCSEARGNLALYCYAIGVVFAVAAHLSILPAVVRRLRDLALPAWFGGVLFLLVLVPYVGFYLPGVALIAIGCLPSKNASGDAVASLSTRLVAAIWGLAFAGMSILAARLGSSIVGYLIARAFENAFKGY